MALDRLRAALLLAGLVVASAPPAEAAVERIEIIEREPFAGGAAFGAVGRYERIVGRLHFAVDPDDPANARDRRSAAWRPATTAVW